MKLLTLAVALTFSLAMSSAVDIDEEVFPFAREFLPYLEYYPHPEVHSVQNMGKGFDINITINLTGQAGNFDGILFTSQQFDSLFPPMKDFNSPQNVSIHLYSPIKPFSILNFTDYHLSLNLNLEVGVLCPTVDNLFTTFNLSGYATLQIFPVLLGFRLYIKDYQINDLIVPDSETSKIDKNAAFVTFNSLGQFGIDYANQVLAKKRFAASHDGYLVPESENYTFQNEFVTVQVTAVDQYL